MAHAVFDDVGGADWAFSRQFIYGQERGAVGQLALAVAASADARPGRAPPSCAPPAPSWRAWRWR